MTEPEKVTRLELDVVLFPEYAGRRIESRKRFPNGTFVLQLPAPSVQFPEDVSAVCMKYYNTPADTIFGKGFNQTSHGERTWDIIKYGGKKAEEVSDAEQIANIEKELGVSLQSPDVIDKARDLFEKAHFMTPRAPAEKGADKALVQKVKEVGVTKDMVEDPEFARLVKQYAERKAKATAVKK